MGSRTYEAQVSTPEQDKILDELRASLAVWLMQRGAEGIDHSLVLTALMLFTASGVASTDISKEAFLDVMGTYLDTYRANLKKQS